MGGCRSGLRARRWGTGSPPLRSVTPLHRSYWLKLLKTNRRESLVPRANREAINVQARYLDGNDSPEDHVEGHLGPHGDLLVQGDLDGDAQHCPVLNKDWERLDAHHVKSERLRTAIYNKIWLQYLSIFDKGWSAVQCFADEGGQLGG